MTSLVVYSWSDTIELRESRRVNMKLLQTSREPFTSVEDEREGKGWEGTGVRSGRVREVNT